MMRYIFVDRRGRTWITADGIYHYFRIVIYERKKYFYDYDEFLRNLE